MSVHSISRRVPARRERTSRFLDAASGEHALTAALLAADITHGVEDFLAIVDVFYAEGVRITNAATGHVIQGRAQLRAAIVRALVPLHVVAESGGWHVSLRQTAQVPSDLADVQDSD